MQDAVRDFWHMQQLNVYSSSSTKRTQDALDGYSRVGLRTLILCKKVLDREEYLKWSKKYKVFFIFKHYSIIQLLLESQRNNEKPEGKNGSPLIEN